MNAIVKIECRWDRQPGVVPGWFYECFNADGNTVSDSQKIWSPVDADDYGIDDYDAMRDALRVVYPDAEVV